ncbi:alpha-L-rhamnosidase C-terminal domain-containing protein [Streptomyces sp. NPDC001351]|uniref:alpha-L-rhamnosidase C-terminal domain-containing protein n=1 Tax=unclassified Streptomyces TaxID=2593676 RepID=UPI0036AD964E
MRAGPRHRTAAGLASATLGYRRLRIGPPPGGGVTQAGARLCTPYGTAEVSWALSGREPTVEAVVPPNTTADAVLPDGRASSRWAPEPRRDHRTGARRSDARRREVPDRPGRAGFESLPAAAFSAISARTSEVLASSPSVDGAGLLTEHLPSST